MRVLTCVIVASSSVAIADDENSRFGLGLRSSIATDLERPKWLLSGESARLRLTPHFEVVADFDVGRTASVDMMDVLRTRASRMLMEVGAAAVVHPWPGRRWDPRVYAGLGFGYEAMQERFLALGDEVEWVDTGSSFRPLGYVGVSLARVFELPRSKRIAVVADLRGRALGGNGPPGMVAELPRRAIHASLGIEIYFGKGGLGR